MPVMRRQRTVITMAVIALPLVAIWWWFVGGQSGNRDVPIIIYVVDTLRADHVGLYDDSVEHTPNLDSLAAESVVFRQAYGPAPWTPPSITSLMTSKHVCEHGVHGGEDGKWINPSHKTFAERLVSAGYFTGSYYSNIWAGPMLGLDRGFEIVADRIDENERVDDVREFLREAGDRPYLLYLHTMEPHHPFETPYPYIREYGYVSVEDTLIYRDLWLVYAMARSIAQWQELYKGEIENTATVSDAIGRIGKIGDVVDLLYDSSVRWADDNLGDVVAALKEEKVWDEAIFVFLSDHGEELYDHDAWFHGQSVYEELVRVPLLMHFPGDEFGGTQIAAPVSLVDLMPTLFDYIGRPESCGDCRGLSFLGMLREERGPGDEPISIQSMRMNTTDYYKVWEEGRGDVNVVVRQGNWKGIFNKDLGSLELYDLALDPKERMDVSAENSATVNRIIAAATDWLRQCESEYEYSERPEMEMDEKTREILKSHSYFN